MLSFTLNNEPLVLSRDTSVRFTWRNPACNFEKIPGDVGMGIDIPVNATNRMLLGNPERFEQYAKNNEREFENFEIRANGMLLMAGTLVIQTASRENYSGWLRSYAGNLGKEHREKFIYDNISFNKEKTFINKADYDPDTDDYGCPEVYNPDFFKEKGEKTKVIRLKKNPNYNKYVWKWIGWEKDIRQYLEEEVEVEDLTEAFMRNASWMINKKNEDGTIKAPETSSYSDPDNVVDNLEVTVVSPMLFLNYVLKTIFKDSGFCIDKNFIADDPDLKKLLIYNNYDITKITHTSSDEAIVYEYFDEINDNPIVTYTPRLESTGCVVNFITRDVDTFFYKDLLPKINLSEFVLSTMNLINVFPFFRPDRKIIDLLDRESILTGDAVDIEKYLLGYWEISEKKDNALKFSFDQDNNDLIFNERWKDISDYRDKEKEPVDSWDDLNAIENPETDEIRFIREANGYAQYKLWLLEWDDNDQNHHEDKYIGWQLLTIGFQNAFFNYGKDTVEEIKTEFSTLDGKTMPNVRQKGNIRSELFSFETFSPRLLFYNGNNTGAYETGTLSLDWEDEDTGLLKKRWSNWARFWSMRQEVTTEAFFDLGMLNFIIRNIYKKFRSKEGEFIIEEMECEFGIDKISNTKIKGYKLNYAPKVISLTDVWYLKDIISVDETFKFDGWEQFSPIITG